MRFRTSRVRSCLTAVVLVSGATVGLSSSASAVDFAPPSTPVIGIHAISDEPADMEGVGAIRLWDTDTTWRVLQPTRGTFSWETLDRRVAEAEAADVEVLLVLGGTPLWASSVHDEDDASWVWAGSASMPDRMADWRRFVAAVVPRYAGRIEAYQVWNEPSLPAFWRGTDEQLARLTSIARAEVKRVDPDALVVAAPLLPRLPGWRSHADGFLSALAKEGWPVDVLSFHGYTVDDGGPDDHAAATRAVVRAFADAGADDLPVWETEVNYPGMDGRRTVVQSRE